MERVEQLAATTAAVYMLLSVKKNSFFFLNAEINRTQMGNTGRLWTINQLLTFHAIDIVFSFFFKHHYYGADSLSFPSGKNCVSVKCGVAFAWREAIAAWHSVVGLATAGCSGSTERLRSLKRGGVLCPV